MVFDWRRLLPNYQEMWFDAHQLQFVYDDPGIVFENEKITVDFIDGHQVVYIGGSDDRKDWRQNFDLKMVEVVDGIKASRGYVESAWNCFKAIRKVIDDELPTRLVGHSKSGATNQPLYLIAKKAGYNITSLRSFGAPMVFKNPVADPVLLRMERITTPSDRIPEWPFDRWYRWKNWIQLGREVLVGEPIDEHIGVLRDAYKSHMIWTYEKELRKLANQSS